jgi:pyruvate/2-oxoglutarate/acetoin dehydrogenase E1 component
VVAPSTAGDAYGLLKSALRASGPVVFIDHKRLFPLAGDVPDGEALVPFGQAAVRREGRDLTIVAHSYTSVLALSAADALAKEGVSADVVDLRSIWPVDWATLAASARRTGRVLFVEEGQPVCGVGAELAFRLRELVPGLEVARLGALRAPVASSPVLEAFVLPDAGKIATAARALLSRPSPREVNT